MNVGFGSSGHYGGSSNPAPVKSAQKTSTSYGNSDEMKFARGLIKSLNVASFDSRLWAYLFVNHAPPAVIKNLMSLMDSFLDVLVERFDNDLSESNEEYNAAVIAKRIQDALETYK